MTNSKAHLPVLLGVLKAMFVGALKLTCLGLAFCLRVISIVLEKIATLLQKAAGHDSTGH